MKNILLFAHDDAGQDARLRVALDVTRTLGGHLVCLDVTLEPRLLDDYVSNAGGAALVGTEVRAEQRNRHRLAQRLADEAIDAELIEAAGYPCDAIADASALADLVVVSTTVEDARFADLRTVAEDMLARAERPVLAVPPTLDAFDATGPALIAWDGSRQAEAALTAAIPLLRHARKVELLHIVDGSLRIPVEDAARYLSRHGIGATIRNEPAGRDKPGPILRLEARWTHAAYVVMGAFGHHRVAEFLFGGTTHTMLAHSHVPLFLASRR